MTRTVAKYPFLYFEYCCSIVTKSKQAIEQAEITQA